MTTAGNCGSMAVRCPIRGDSVSVRCSSRRRGGASNCRWPAAVTGAATKLNSKRWGAALDRAHAEGARRLTVTGDSDFVVRHLRGERQTGVEPLRRLIRTVSASMARFDAVDLTWVPRHRNRDADRLSRAALGLPDKPAPVPGRGRRRSG